MAPLQESPDESYEVPQRRVRGESIASMSQLLLQGWAMLADCCPECRCPLMRHPSGEQLLCVNCWYDTATAEPSGVEAAPVTAAAEDSQGDGAATGASRLQRPPNATVDGHASGDEEGGDEELLQPPPPLASRLRQTASAATAESAQQPATGSGAAAARGRQQQGDQDASKRIAELMLEGWAMLQDHCPRCLNPLLRSRDRRIYCAGCQMFAVHEGEVAPQQEHPAAPQPGTAGTANQHAAATQAQAVRLETTSPASDSQAGLGSTCAIVEARAAKVAPALLRMQQHVPAVEAAAAAVAEQLAGATAALRGGAGQAAPLLAHVQQCAAALQALCDCQRSLASLS